MSTAKNIEQLIALSLLVLLIIGSYLVLRPFVSALLWAALLCYATWPIFLRLNRELGERRAWSALLLCLAIAAVVVAPFIVVGLSLADLTKLQAQGNGRANDINCILLFLVGAPSHLDTWDLKPNAPDNIRGPFRPIQKNYVVIER